MSLFSKTFQNPSINIIARSFSTNKVLNAEHSCKLLVVGGGAGGCAVAAKFSRRLKKEEIIVVEPSDVHYYQAMFTLIGGGIKSLQQSVRPTKSVLPTNATWLKDSVTEFNPDSNFVKTKNGDTIKYQYMLVAMGLQLHYEQIPGAVEALETPGSGVCSNYSPKYVDKTYQTLQSFTKGNAIFNFPHSQVKCAGAPQKACYIAEHYFRKTGKRDGANVIYNTSLRVIFGIKKYADALWKVAKSRNITVNVRTNLVEIKPKEKVAIFENLDNPAADKTKIKYEMLHVTPPMSTPDALHNCKELVNMCGYVDVDKSTLQHIKYKNVFAIGDCGSTPNAKTAAAVASQSGVVYAHLWAMMENKPVPSSYAYNGYASCPLVTGYGSCILAEFDYSLEPLETFPLIGQDREMYSMYLLKKDVMPQLYWRLMLNGYWNGPGVARKVMRLGM